MVLPRSARALPRLAHLALPSTSAARPRRAAPAPARRLSACPAISSRAKSSAAGNVIAAHKSAECRNEKCGLQRNRVVERHEAALAHRRADYLREVSTRSAAPRPRPAPPTPPTDLRFVRATDGRRYKLAACQPLPPAAACGPCRRPPPPQLLALDPIDRSCEIQGSGYVDPCAHQPKIVVRVDRSQPRDKGGEVDLTPDVPERPSSVCKKPVVGGAKFAGDSGWCESLPPPAAVQCGPPPARRAPPCRDIRCGPRPPARHLHTAAAALLRSAESCAQNTPVCTKNLTNIATQTKENAKKFESMLKARNNLKEAARGRVVTCSTKAKSSSRAAGGLEMAVPPGATALKVSVSLEAASVPPAPRAASAAAPLQSPCGALQSPCGARAAVTAACSTPLSAPTVVSRAVPCEDRLDLSVLQLVHKNTVDSPKSSCQDPCRPKPLPCLAPKVPKNPCANPATTTPKGPCPSTPKKDPSKDNPCAPAKKAPSKKDEKKKTSSSGGLALLASVCN